MIFLRSEAVNALKMLLDLYQTLFHLVTLMVLKLFWNDYKYELLITAN